MYKWTKIDMIAAVKASMSDITMLFSSIVHYFTLSFTLHVTCLLFYQCHWGLSFKVYNRKSHNSHQLSCFTHFTDEATMHDHFSSKNGRWQDNIRCYHSVIYRASQHSHQTALAECDHRHCSLICKCSRVILCRFATQ